MLDVHKMCGVLESKWSDQGFREKCEFWPKGSSLLNEAHFKELWQYYVDFENV